MKIRIIKKLAKQKRLTTPKLQDSFLKALPHSKSIRNACYRGMIRMGDYNKYVRFATKYGDLKLSIGWQIMEP